jgi:hypothetical protein
VRTAIGPSYWWALELEEQLQVRFGLQVGLESSFVGREVQKILQGFGKALRTFGHDLMLPLRLAGLGLHLQAGESFRDVGSFPVLPELRDYMLREQNWMLPDFEGLLRLEGL